MTANQYSAAFVESRKVEAPIGMSTALVSLLVVFIPLFALAVFGDEAVDHLRAVSAKFELLKSGSAVIVVGLLVVFATIALGSWLLASKRFLFVALFLFAVSFSEVTVSSLNQSAFALRYLLFTIVTALGLLQLFRWNRDVIDASVIVGVLLFVWIAIDVALTGFDTNAVSMIPIQITLMFGVLVGLKSRFLASEDIRGVCILFGWMGAIMTLVHFAAYFVHAAPFIGGRFRSIHPLPTNFANAYVLLYIGMIWMLIYETRIVIKVVLLLLAVIGIALIFLSGTRNAMLAITIALAVFAFAWRARILVYGAIAALVVGIIAGEFYENTKSTSELTQRLSNSDTVRWEVWERAIGYVQARPFTGYGLGVGMNKLDHRMPEWLQFDTHNAYLGIWLQIGFVGLALVVALYFIALKTAATLLLSRRLDKKLRDIVILPVTLLIVLLIAGMFEENLTSRGSLQQILWTFCIALTMNVGRIAAAETRT